MAANEHAVHTTSFRLRRSPVSIFDRLWALFLHSTWARMVMYSENAINAAPHYTGGLESYHF